MKKIEIITTFEDGSEIISKPIPVDDKYILAEYYVNSSGVGIEERFTK